MRTTLDLDDDLVRALAERLPGRSKTDAIETAIATYLEHDGVARLRQMAGSLEIEDLSAERRAAERERAGRPWHDSPS